MKSLPLLVVLGGLSGCLESNINNTDKDASSSSSDATTSSSDTSSTGEPETTTGDSTENPTTGIAMPVCGDGLKGDGEGCDDGEANAEDAACTPECELNVCGDGYILAGMEGCDDGPQNADDAACTSSCKPATCGDGHVLASVEMCDDGTNDGSYGSCLADCSAQAAHCGDGIIDSPEEECDDPGDPACLSSCMFARSCLVIHESNPELQSGPRTIYPVDPTKPVEVVCDMETDGGGYTFLKVDVDSPQNDLPYPASKAETICAQYGMHLFVPRSAAHLASAYGFSTVDNVLPVGGGSKGSSVDYLQILGIYPVTPGKSCLADALNPTECPQWAPLDGEVWYVSDVSKNPSEPDPDSACKGCSMV
ncbi:MAG TPA: fibrinogen-like YCDxxxxGGGW domain-containing protein, partial [Nannocystis sp.]